MDQSTAQWWCLAFEQSPIVCMYFMQFPMHQECADYSAQACANQPEPQANIHDRTHYQQNKRLPKSTNRHDETNCDEEGKGKGTAYPCNKAIFMDIGIVEGVNIRFAMHHNTDRGFGIALDYLFSIGK
jgi:hypothetical protein